MSPGKVTLINISLESPTTVYDVQAPENTIHFTLQSREGKEIQVGFNQDYSNWLTVKVGGTYYEQNIRFSGVLHFKCPNPPTIVECIFWSIPN